MKANASKRSVRYFVSYTRDDVKLPDKLLAELRKKLGADGDYDFQPWRDTGILVGKDWDEEIKAALAACDFGLLLVSPAFLGKKYITEIELPVFVRGDKPCVIGRGGPKTFAYDGSQKCAGSGGLSQCSSTRKLAPSSND